MKTPQKQTSVERFYAWLLKVKNVHTNNQQAMDRAFIIIAEAWDK